MKTTLAFLSIFTGALAAYPPNGCNLVKMIGTVATLSCQSSPTTATCSTLDLNQCLGNSDGLIVTQD